MKDTEEILEDLKNDRVPKAGPRYDITLILATISRLCRYSCNTLHMFGILSTYAEAYLMKAHCNKAMIKYQMYGPCSCPMWFYFFSHPVFYSLSSPACFCEIEVHC